MILQDFCQLLIFFLEKVKREDTLAVLKSYQTTQSKAASSHCGQFEYSQGIWNELCENYVHYRMLLKVIDSEILTAKLMLQR